MNASSFIKLSNTACKSDFESSILVLVAAAAGGGTNLCMRKSGDSSDEGSCDGGAGVTFLFLTGGVLGGARMDSRVTSG